jgi:trk system potassium uptake protein TrkA
MTDKTSSTWRARLWPSDRSSGAAMVIGLGRFGSALAHTLVEMGHEVLAVDSDAQRVHDHAVPGIEAKQADCTNIKVLEQVGARDVSVAVVCIGTDIESSVLATAALVDLEVPKIWAKAITEAHGKILTRVGAHRVVFPESQMGKRTAHLVTGAMLEYISLDDDFVLVELPVTKPLHGVRLGSSDLRAKHHITIVCVKHIDEPFTYTTADTVLREGDLVVIAGHRHHVERFATSH